MKMMRAHCERANDDKSRQRRDDANSILTDFNQQQSTIKIRIMIFVNIMLCHKLSRSSKINHEHFVYCVIWSSKNQLFYRNFFINLM